MHTRQHCACRLTSKRHRRPGVGIVVRCSARESSARSTASPLARSVLLCCGMSFRSMVRSGSTLPSAIRPRSRLAHGSCRAPRAPRLPCQSAPELGAAWLWRVLSMRLMMRWGSVSGVPWGDGLRKGDLGRLGGSLFQRLRRLCRPETPRTAHTSPSEATRDVVGLGDPVERFLAQTGRCNRRWDGGQLEMTQDARDHRLLGDCGHDPERAAPAKVTCGHIQSKHAPQEPAPVSGRCSSLCLIHAHTYWRGVGIIASRSALCSAKQPA